MSQEFCGKDNKKYGSSMLSGSPDPSILQCFVIVPKIQEGQKSLGVGVVGFLLRQGAVF